MIEASRTKFYDTSTGNHVPWKEIGLPEVSRRVSDVPPWVFSRLTAAQKGEARPLYVDNVTISSFVPAGKSLDPHQYESVGYILTGDDVLLGDDAGLGKTIIAAVYLNLIDARRILVVSPSSVKYNWMKEITAWSTRGIGRTPGDIHVIEGRKNGEPRNDSYSDILSFFNSPDFPRVVIINYDLLESYRDFLCTPGLTWDVAIFDEAHRINNIKSGRSLVVYGGKKGKATLPGIAAHKRIFASATPLNRPIHLWAFARACDNRPSGLGADWFKYVRQYCNAFPTDFGWNTSGKSNLEELRLRMESSFLIRHPDSVLNLPPYYENTIVFPRSDEVYTAQADLVRKILGLADDNVAAYDFKQRLIDAGVSIDSIISPLADDGEGSNREISAYLEAGVRILADSLADATSSLKGVKPLFEEMASVRKMIGIGKIPRAIAYILDVLARDEDEPLLIFAHHKEVVTALVDAISAKGISVEPITGDVPAWKKEEVKVAFQEGRLRVIVANMAAGGEGITLTRSNHVIFVETDWNASTIRQCFKRIHRRGQKRTCIVDFLLMDETVDVYVTKVFLDKKATFSEVMGE